MTHLGNPLLKSLTLVILAFVLTACATLGPDYREPEVEWLEDWQSNLYGQLVSPEQQSRIDLRFWWRLFDDPVLNGLMDLANQENPSLRIAGLRILESRAALKIAKGNQYPQVQQATGAINYVPPQHQAVFKT